jgi:hypothetical protein
MRVRRIAVVSMLGAVLLGPVPVASALPVLVTGEVTCQHAARRYETHCLMPRIEARLRFAADDDGVAFVTRMREIDGGCTEVTAAGLARCVAWPRVRPSAEYRRWLRDVREAWERREDADDGLRPACPPAAPHCL